MSRTSCGARRARHARRASQQQPGQPGRIVWISGPPGAGKSTTCQLLAREKGYVYLELDSVVSLINPFPDINAENPTLAGFRGKAVKVTG